MSITPWIPAVRKIKDGESVDQTTVNVPIEQMTQREQHLYEKFEQIGDKSVLQAFNQPIHPDENLIPSELNLVYFKNDSGGYGISKSLSGFSTSTSSSFFSPKDSNYSFGIVKAIYPDKTADLYIEGLCEFSVDLDDPIKGLIKDEVFEIGPYYLSLKSPGKITKDPAGIPVYVGYAISKRKFLLHPNVDEFSQFFINYRYHVLDRVAGIPHLTANTWNISLKEYADTPIYLNNSGNLTGVQLENISTAYEGILSQNIRKEIYKIKVTTAGNLNSVRFSVISSYGSFAAKLNQALNNESILIIDDIGNNDIKLNFTGSTNFTLNTEWALTVSTYPRKLGWIAAEDAVAAGAIAPPGAVFYYNIPNSLDIDSDQGLDNYVIDEGTANERIIYFEKDEALDFKKYIPPLPANFIQLYIDGVLLRYKDIYDVDGVYSVNEYGLWWYAAEDGKQPWASTYPEDDMGFPELWKSSIKSTIADSRKNIFVSFSKFNPALKTQLVSSLKAFNTSTDKTSNFLNFYNAEDINSISPTGDILLSINAPTEYVGYKSEALTTSDLVSLNDDFVYPPLEYTGGSYPRSTDITFGRAIAAIKYSKTRGAFTAAITPVVSKITGSGGINVTPQGNGIWNVDYLSQGITGQVDSIEPINARLEFRGLTSFIKFPYPSATPYGLIGKILLPKGYPGGKSLKLIFHVFGDVSSTSDKNIAFDFEYSTTPIYRAALSSTQLNQTIVNNASDYTSIAPIQFSLTSEDYTAYRLIKIQNEEFYIPAERIIEDTVINFKISRVIANENNYAGNLCITGIYWEIS
jgi:hypothetical protein